MSVNIQLENRLKTIAGGKLTSRQVTKALGYTPANVDNVTEIIDVDELPIENINSKALYRLTKDVYKVSTIDYSDPAMQAQATYIKVIVVDALPEIGKDFNDFIVYYNKTEDNVYLYTEQTWLTSTDAGYPYLGCVSAYEEMTSTDGLYLIHEKQHKLYEYTDGQFVEILTEEYKPQEIIYRTIESAWTSLNNDILELVCFLTLDEGVVLMQQKAILRIADISLVCVDFSCNFIQGSDAFILSSQYFGSTFYILSIIDDNNTSYSCYAMSITSYDRFKLTIEDRRLNLNGTTTLDDSYKTITSIILDTEPIDGSENLVLSSGVYSALKDKADKADTYSKTEVNDLVNEVPEKIEVTKMGGTNNDVELKYSLEFDGIKPVYRIQDPLGAETDVSKELALKEDLSNKANTSDVYTKDEVDQIVEEVNAVPEKIEVVKMGGTNNDVELKYSLEFDGITPVYRVKDPLGTETDVSKELALKEYYYTKTEVDNLIATSGGSGSTTGKVVYIDIGTSSRPTVGVLKQICNEYINGNVVMLRDLSWVYTINQVQYSERLDMIQVKLLAQSFSGDGKIRYDRNYYGRVTDSDDTLAITVVDKDWYTADKVDEMLALKADKSDIPEKIEVTKMGGTNNDVELKYSLEFDGITPVYRIQDPLGTETDVSKELALKEDHYTKNEVDDLIAASGGSGSTTGKVVYIEISSTSMLTVGILRQIYNEYLNNNVVILLLKSSSTTQMHPIVHIHHDDSQGQVWIYISLPLATSAHYYCYEFNLSSDDESMVARSNVVYSFYTKTEVDNKLALKANVADVYTKTEMDNLISTETPDKIQKVVLSGSDGSVEVFYTVEFDANNKPVFRVQNPLSSEDTDVSKELALKGDIDEQLVSKANSADVYTKDEVYSKDETYSKTEINTTHNNMDTAIRDIEDSVRTLSEGVYTKDETYSKTEIDNKIMELDDSLYDMIIEKPDKSEVYTKDETYSKTEVDNLVNEVPEKIQKVVLSGPDGSVEVFYTVEFDANNKPVFRVQNPLSSENTDVSKELALKEDVDDISDRVTTNATNITNLNAYVTDIENTLITVRDNQLTEDSVNSLIAAYMAANYENGNTGSY